MARRTLPIGRTVLTLIALLVAGAADGRTETTGSALAAALGLEEGRPERQRRTARDLLGADRWRRLDAARFEISLYDHPFTPALADAHYRHDEVARILRQSVVKLAQRSALAKLRLYERRDALRDRLRGDESPPAKVGARLEIRPRIRFTDRPWLGAKLRLAGADSGLWARTSLRVGSEVDGGNPSVKLAFRGDSRRAFLVYHSDHRRRGEALELQLGFSF